MGYSDGSRFFTNDDPNIAQMQAQLQKQAKVIQDLTTKVQEKMTGHQVKLESSKILAETQIKTTQIKEDNNNMRNATTHLRAIREQDQSVAHDVAKMGLAHQHSLEKNQQQHQHSMAQAAAQPEPQQPMAAAA
jgi:hypothetical protein